MHHKKFNSKPSNSAVAAGQNLLSIPERPLNRMRKILWTLMATLWIVAGFSPLAQSQDTAEKQPDNKVHITSDRLDTDTDARFAEFSGNVHASQGTTEIFSDKLKIFYKKSSDDQTGGVSGSDSIQRIVATGNVRIHFGERKAVADQAEYDTEARLLVLTGEKAEVTDGNNFISGEKITLDRTTGRATVESSKKRVEALIYSGQIGIE